MMFSREHHKSVITVLNALAPDYFQARQCYFGGGTLLALEFGEYRESVDIDFLIANVAARATARLARVTTRDPPLRKSWPRSWTVITPRLILKE